MSKYTMVEEYAFTGAHRIESLPEGSRDRGMHGHTWAVKIEVAVNIDPARGLAFDHVLLDDVSARVLSQVDHKVINEVEGLELGTNEVLAHWLGMRFLVEIESLVGPDIEGVDFDADPYLTRLVLTQYSSGRTYRLTKHETIWVPSYDDHVEARRMLAERE